MKAKRLTQAMRGLGRGTVVVEIGCARYSTEIPSDGWSTIYLAQEAARRGWDFHSVDTDPAAIETARTATANLPVRFHCARGERWLYTFSRKISGLYLDGSDNPDETLLQYRAARLADQAVVVVDDAQAMEGRPLGKANTVLIPLRQDGFRVRVHKTEPGYQMAVATR